MADLSKLKKRTTLGEPPPLEEASTNLEAPEVAPVAQQEPRRISAARRIDGRSLRRTGRTVQFATRVSEQFDSTFRRIAQRDGLHLGELLERALASYEASKND